MKLKILTIAIVLIACITALDSQATIIKIDSPTVSEDTGTHTMLHADSTTIYFDATGNKIDTKQFAESMKSGKFTILPNIKDGKVVSIKLKASEQKVTMGSPAPEFSGTDLNGHTIDLKALKGKTVILNFWFTSCVPCMAEIPELNDLAAKYKNDSSIVFVAITYNSPEQVKAFLKRKDFRFNILTDRSDIIERYGIVGYSTSIVIDQSGNVTFLLTTYDGANVARLDGVIGALKKI